MWTLLHVIYDFRIPFTNKQECVLVFMFFGGIFHPLLTAFSMLYLIFKVSGYFLRISLKKGRYVINKYFFLLQKIKKKDNDHACRFDNF